MSEQDKFYNPYYFTPTNAPSEATLQTVWHSNRQTIDSSSQLSHAKYQQLSGRIICRLTTESRLFIGAHRPKDDGGSAKDNKPVLEHFKIAGEHAIPASSLRGLISGIYESATGSALRVLDDQAMSSRMSASKGMSAIGIIWTNATGELSLIPLTYPTLSKKDNYYIPESFKPYVAQLRFKIYSKQADNKRKSFSLTNQQYFHIAGKDKKPLQFKHQQQEARDKEKHADWARHPRNKKDLSLANQEYVIGQRVSDYQNDFDFNDLILAEGPGPAAGILRVFDIPAAQMGTRYHDLFIPTIGHFDDDCYKHAILPRKVIDRFERMALQRNETIGELPYRPTDDTQEKEHCRLKKGDLVYFDLKHVDKNQDGLAVVKCVAFSSIWRKEIDGTVGEFFDPNLQPMTPRRAHLSPADVLFGFVSDGKAQSDDPGKNAAYAGRIRLSDAQIPPSKSINPIATKIGVIGSPKLPCPSMYFKTRDTTQRKSDLSKRTHIPQGRKYYVHQQSHPFSGDEKTLNCTPPGATFYFAIDFDNLSEAELNALCYALQPNQDYRHKLGMGKPLGLGQVKLEPVALRLIDRQSRYFSADLCSHRYSKEWQASDFVPSEIPANWQEPAVNPQAQATLPPEIRAVQFRSGEDHFCDIDACAALEVIGAPQSTASYPVHYPQTKDQKGQLQPTEQFKWFVVNNNQGQCLAPVTNGSLTPLLRNERSYGKR